MSGFRFIDTDARETEKLDLPNGEHVIIKKSLTNGEQRRIDTAGFKSLEGTSKDEDARKLNIDWEATEFEKVYTYLVGWSGTAQFNKQNLKRMDAEDFNMIKDAIDAYTEEKEKNSKPATVGSEAGEFDPTS